MYEIKTVKNYRTFADELAKKTGCSIKIKLMNEKGTHIHYQLNDKYDMTLGVLCIDNGTASFAPFVDLNSAKDNQYINLQYMPQFDDFIKVLSVFKEMFVIKEENI